MIHALGKKINGRVFFSNLQFIFNYRLVFFFLIYIFIFLAIENTQEHGLVPSTDLIQQKEKKKGIFSNLKLVSNYRNSRVKLVY